MISGDQFGFGFRKIEWDAVRLRIGGHQVAEESHDLSVKDIPVWNESPEVPLLRVYDIAQAKATRHDQHAHEREPKRNFVAHHLGAGPQSTQQGILVVRGSSGECHAVNADRGHAEEQQASRVDGGGDMHWETVDAEYDM